MKKRKINNEIGQSANKYFLCRYFVFVPRHYSKKLSISITHSPYRSCNIRNVHIGFLFRYFIVSYAIAFNSIILFFMGGCVANKSAHQPS